MKSLRIIHTADWHLGQTFFGYDRDAEHAAFLDWLAALLEKEQADALLIAGDVFDVANPSAQAQHRFYHFLKEANSRNPGMQTVVIAGNHDSAVRLEAPNPLLEELRARVIGLVPRTGPGQIDFDRMLLPLYNKEGERCALCLAVPFLRQGDYPAADDMPDTYAEGICRMYREFIRYVREHRAQPGEALIGMGHLYASGVELSADDGSERILQGGLESVPASAFDGYDYVALGHIHKAQRVGGSPAVRYAGSPLPMSFSETAYRHQVLSIEICDGQVERVTPVPVPVTAELKRVPLVPLPPDEVLEQLAALPVREGKEADEARFPYLEVHVLLTEPDPGFRHRVEEALEGKAVRLAGIIPSYPADGSSPERVPLTVSDLQRIQPLDMLRHAFQSKYGGELPPELEELFNETVRDSSLS